MLSLRDLRSLDLDVQRAQGVMAFYITHTSTGSENPVNE